jgi:hypothetical protein
MSKNIIFLFFLLSIIEISKLQEIDKDMMRAVACLSLIRKLDNKPSDQRVLSTYILTCFVTIDDSTAQKLIMSQTSNKLDLSQEQIEKLTNIYEVEKKFTEDQIMDYSKALNDALERLKNAGPDGLKAPPKGSSSSNSNKKRESGSGLFGNMITGLLGLFSTNDSLLLLFGLFIGFYLFLRQMRKCCGNNEKNKTGNNNKSKIKKRGKKIE